MMSVRGEGVDCACDAVTTGHPPGAATGYNIVPGKAAAPASVSGICGYQAAIPRPTLTKKERKTYLRISFLSKAINNKGRFQK